MIYSLIETCKQQDIDPFAYLADVLKRLPTTLHRDLHTLRPGTTRPKPSSARAIIASLPNVGQGGFHRWLTN